MLVAAAVCPHPPALHPALSAGTLAELESLRAACDEAVRALISAAPEVVVAVGGVRADEPLSTGLGSYGADVVLSDEPLPLSLLLATYLLNRVGWDGARVYECVAADAGASECLEGGKALAERPRRVAMLVMGDGSARRTEKAPGWIHPDAGPFDEAVARALGSADIAALAELDPETCDRLLVGGRAAWQVLAGAARGHNVMGRLLFHDAPYGVGYFVALWTRQPGTNSSTAA